MPINNITQTISTIPEAGRRGVDVQTVFVTKQEDFQDHLQGTTVTELNALKTQMNTMAGEMNTTASQVNTNANTATTKASEASASATSASASASTATTKASEASASATLANKWANEAENVIVALGQYSAYHWSKKAEVTVDGKAPLESPTFTGEVSLPELTRVNGELISPYSGFKNYIINGNFDIWQRGTSHTTNTDIKYGSADRWRTINQDATNFVVTRQTVSGVVPFQAKHFIRQTVVLNTTSGTVLDQLIEGARQFSNKTITLSLWVKGEVGKKIALAFQVVYGSGGTPSTAEDIIGEVYTLTGSWEKINITRTIPDVINGKTYGTDGTDYLRVLILTQANTIGLSPEVFFQSGTFDIAQVQLEEGSVATPFENRPYGLELSLCQRYYEELRNGETLPVSNNLATERGHFRFSVYKRITPTCTFAFDTGTGGGFKINIGGGYQIATHSVVSGFSVKADAEL